MKGRGLVAIALLLMAWQAAAQDYPTRPVRAIVAVGAGGTGDIMMRVLGEELHRRWGQAIVVEPPLLSEERCEHRGRPLRDALEPC